MQTTTDYATITHNGYEITLYGEINSGFLELELYFENTETGESFTTRHSEDWPKADEILPRSQWPTPMFAGKQHEHREDVPAEFTDAIQRELRTDVKDLISETAPNGEQEDMLKKLGDITCTGTGEIFINYDGKEMSYREFVELTLEM